MTRLPDPVRRALRTFLQAFVGTLLTMWLSLGLAPGELPPGDVAKRVLIAAVLTLIDVLGPDGVAPFIYFAF